MLNKIDELCAERDRLKKAQPRGAACLAGQVVNRFDDKADHPPWIKALAEVRRLAPREGWRYQHVQAIIAAIDQLSWNPIRPPGAS
jgi:hypothetical protein